MNPADTWLDKIDKGQPMAFTRIVKNMGALKLGYVRIAATRGGNYTVAWAHGSSQVYAITSQKREFVKDLIDNSVVLTLCSLELI